MSIVRIPILALLFLTLLCAGGAWAQSPVNIPDYPAHGTELTPPQRTEMNRFAAAVVAVVNGGARLQISVIGHADFDPQGREFENRISRERAENAQATLRELIDQQARDQAVPPEKLRAVTYLPPIGMGTQSPVFRPPLTPEKRAANRRVQLVWVGTPAPPPPPPQPVTCVKPVTGANPPRSQWAELEAKAASAPMNPQIMRLQPIQDAMGEINTDFFAITIDAQGQTAPQLLLEYRANISRWIAGGSGGQSLAPYDATNAAMWNSPNYNNAVLSFVLWSLPIIGIQAETGAVVVTCSSATDWVFTTVTTIKDGAHPVSGNRSFGVLDNHDGTLMLFTKGTDRVIDQLPYNTSAPTVFEKGEAFWRHFLDNVAKQYATRHPRRTEISLRRPYF